MIKTAIVEDDVQDTDILKSYLERYAKEHNITIDVKVFSDGEQFLMGNRQSFDIIFLDIEMPGVNGMETAKRIRQTDMKVKIAFVTNVIHYAVEGYSVEACAYFVKPLAYPDFCLKFVRILQMLSRDTEKLATLNSVDGVVNLPVSEIAFIEVRGHYVTYHTARGEFVVRETIGGAEERFLPYHFVRIGNSYIVNLACVEMLTGDDVTVRGAVLKISRSKKQAFLTAFAEYMGGSK
ncbi:MAG: response regulator transcription factor [Clostridia bacterium]|nr:response regulator transcription factor [Clostridia bacterium]